ncbi:antitoxin of toxin-antitoxin stability system [Cupriavidus taiwanensis]|uniref:antitoxin of toxin-antitoxin stability system n=1 Tax=Cupriavidus taiwanensis TaxID=164546 RepID=UPI000E120457|nr:antitoxin of toxin-antitoxin stability system [Cupriavidus taiwanensis]SPC10383.1 putative antitoxin of a toxin/antitoxin system [Cupriavidus taiwanensis]
MLVSEEIQFTFTLKRQLRDAFIAAAEAEGHTISQVAEELIRQYLEQCEKSRDDDALFQQMVEQGRTFVRAGIGIPNEQVEADSADWCAAMLRQA